MRRLLLVVLGLGLVAACAYVVTLSLGDSDDATPEAMVMPYPRTLQPLPVPEMRIGEGPWADPLPTPLPLPLPATPPRSPEQIPKSADGLTCYDKVVPDAKGQGGKFRACQTG